MAWLIACRSLEPSPVAYAPGWNSLEVWRAGCPRHRHGELKPSITGRGVSYGVSKPGTIPRSVSSSVSRPGGVGERGALGSATVWQSLGSGAPGSF